MEEDLSAEDIADKKKKLAEVPEKYKLDLSNPLEVYKV